MSVTALLPLFRDTYEALCFIVNFDLGNFLIDLYRDLPLVWVYVRAAPYNF